ncbi:MAG: chromate transporter [Clostridia bacterium]|nr:chromate transporter [Clostridia bacterium]
MIYLKLFWSFFQIGLFSFGGGYAAVPLIQHQIVDLNNWLSIEEFADIVTISQMTPGPIAINSATFVGIRIGGMAGAVCATFGCVFPSCIIVLSLACIYYRYRNISFMQGILRGLRPAVVSMLASALISIAALAFWNGNTVSFDITKINFISVFLFGICLFVLKKLKMNPITVMLGSGIAGCILYFFQNSLL